MKKLFALLLALTLALSLGAVAFADNDDELIDYDLIPEDPAPMTDHVFTAYQIFSGTQAENEDDNDELADIKWGSGVNGSDLLSALKGDSAFGTGNANIFKGCDSAAAVAEVFGGENITAEQAREFAQLAYDNKEGNGTAVVSNETKLASGYYLIVDTTTGDITSSENFVYNLSLLQLTDDNSTVQIASKVDYPTVEKKIVEGSEKKSVNEASIGDLVNYEITGTLPSNLNDYETYFYKFTDTLTKGLTFKDNIVVTQVDGDKTKDVTSSFSVKKTEYDPSNGTTITVTNQNVKALEGVTSSTKFVVTYSAMLNENAVIAGPNPNTVDLEYSNKPDKSRGGEPTPDDTPHDPTGKTPEKQTDTYTTELTILKTDENGKALAGAEFELTGDGVNVVIVTAENFVEDKNGEYWKLTDGTYTTDDPTTEGMDTSKYASTEIKYTKKTTITCDTKGNTPVPAKAFVDDKGLVTFTGLGVGKYTITETTTPAGYNTIAPISFTVGFDSTTAKFSTGAEDSVEVGTDNKLYTTIENQSGTVLPETGGIGTTIFYVVGAVLVAGAAIVLFARKRAEE